MQLNHYSSFPSDIPIIVEDELFLYPFMISPIFLSDDKNIEAANFALENDTLIMICSTKEGQESEREFDSIYPVGVIGSIMRKIALPDGRIKILFQGLTKGRIEAPVDNTEMLLATVDVVETEEMNSQKLTAILEVVREKVRTLSSVSNLFPPDLLRTIEDNHEHTRIIDLIASSIKLTKNKAYQLFVESNLELRYLKLVDYLIEEIEANKLQKEIRSKVHNRIEKVNKEYFLKEQLKQIQKELGSDTQREEEIEEYRSKLDGMKKHMSEDAYKEVDKQLNRFSRMHPDSADANTIQGYLEWVLEIPFGKLSKKKLEIDSVAKQLDKDHFSLIKPKERIVEYFAVKELLQLRGKSEEGKGAILCFAGPPGVGKTSLANSIATSLKRPLIRVALGGLEDVNELRGHRRTYVGAMPGRIVQGLIEAKNMNPVIVLDEIDKVARSGRGDPTAVLLEILDPEQNTKFRDYYTNFNIDLSQAIFIATANDVGKIPAPLRDRMEFIMVNSYTPQEKLEIAKRYLLPQEIKKHGLKSSEVSVAKGALQTIIANYTRESGVRNLRRRIADIVRKSARSILEDGKDKVSVTLKALPEFLDKTVFEIDKTDGVPRVGVVNGLAWTAVGGDVLKIEAIRIKGKGGLQLTGSLGEVMKESARISMSVVKTLIDTKRLAIDAENIPLSFKEMEDAITPDASEVYKRYDLHLHVPDGATPKDGPSAGIAMTTVFASILSNRAIRSDVAMTGEVSLKGDVMPIGGLKEKIIAAHKAEIKTVLIPRKNFERDMDDIPDEIKESLSIKPMDIIEDVLKETLV